MGGGQSWLEAARSSVDEEVGAETGGECRGEGSGAWRQV